jgi:hypothetical protein
MLENWTEFENGGTYIHAGPDCTGRPSTSRPDANAAQMEEIILGKRGVTIRDVQY